MTPLQQVKMKEVSAERLLEIGRELHASGERWHNHVLSPDCQINPRTQSAVVVEASGRGSVYVAYSDDSMMDLGRALATMVHGVDPLEDSGDGGEQADLRPESPAVAEMMARAHNLAERGRHWHHHILFPECNFNPHPGQWTLVFEDPETLETLESVTPERPARDIRVTETLFFSQTAHS
ncbi:MAG TPA: hypothetical protein QGG47_01920 [Acidobacteriota bacterium]|nr:hypothetical protein [Acidobacteriota bacterium]